VIIETGKVAFRPYGKTDLDVCSRLAVDTWIELSRLVSGKSLDEVMRAYVESSYYLSTWREVACVSGSVVGFIFGRIKSDFKPVNMVFSFYYYSVMILKLLLGGYWRIGKFAFLRKLASTESKAMMCSPRVDGRIELFAVDSKYRGMGIGRELANRFISVARRRRVKSVSLSTDSLSNWRFYEIYGFQRYCSFYDDVNSYLDNRDLKGYIYKIDIK
jgi:ribosomal protein S18 acetylase RimI-like enzyme